MTTETEASNNTIFAPFVSNLAEFDKAVVYANFINRPTTMLCELDRFFTTEKRLYRFATYSNLYIANF